MYKKRLFSISAASTVFIALFASSTALAQTPVVHPATRPDTSIGVGSIPNSALIYYDPNCPGGPGACGSAQLRGVSFTNSTSGFIINDGINTPITIVLPTGDNNPDIALGNDPSGTYYIAAVVYTDNTGNIGLNTYNITGAGALGALHVIPTGTYHLTTYTTAARIPHIDIIADYSILLPGGLPYCSRFAITWSDLDNTSPNFGINGYYASLTAPASGTPTVVPGPGYGYSDVAAITRLVAGSVHDYALFTYLGSSSLYYQEWDMTTGTFGSPVVLMPSAADKYPRIDATDNYNTNSGGLMNWCVTDNYFTGSATSIRIYNNLLPIPGGMDISSYYLSGVGVNTPVVAAGPSNFYTISYMSNMGFNYAQIIDRNTGRPLGFPSTVDYYRVNQTPISSPGIQNVTVSPSCNNNTYILDAWSSSSHLFEKTTKYPFTFKATGVSSISSGSKWSLSPNPATNIVTINTPANFTKAQYSVYDVAGKAQFNGEIIQNNQSIDITNLAAGIYLMHINASGVESVVKFIKQ